MSKPFDYSKWDNIELSDDEDDVHPNIDRESWFRMKHRSRVEREEREEEDKKRIHEEMSSVDLRIREINKLISEIDKERASASADDEDDDDDEDDLEDREGLIAELKELKTANRRRQEKLDDYEKNKKWNVDNMCHVVDEKTLITKNAADPEFSESGYALPPEEERRKQAAAVQAKMEECEIAGDKGDGEKTKEDVDVSAAASVTTGDGQKKKEKGKPPKSTESPIEAVLPSSQKPKTSTSAAVAGSKSVVGSKSKAGPEQFEKADSASVAMLTYVDFTDKYADVLEEFMTLRSLEKSKEFLLQNGHILLQENASSYLLLASLEDEMNGHREKMRLTARQSQIMTNIAELAKTLKAHPGNVIVPFFRRMDEPEYLKSFLEGVEAFIEKVIARAVVKKKEMDAEREKQLREAGEEYVETDLSSVPREERLGPGGLDPVEVFDTLPKKMQEAFESREVEKLKEALMELSPQDAEYHMKRCVDSGLWTEG